MRSLTNPQQQPVPEPTPGERRCQTLTTLRFHHLFFLPPAGTSHTLQPQLPGGAPRVPRGGGGALSGVLLPSHPPAASIASSIPRNHPRASSCSTASRKSAAAPLTPLSSSLRILSRSSAAEKRSRQGCNPTGGGGGIGDTPRGPGEGVGRGRLTVGQPVRHVAQHVDRVEAPLDVAAVALQAPLLLRRHG